MIDAGEAVARAVVLVVAVVLLHIVQRNTHTHTHTDTEKSQAIRYHTIPDSRLTALGAQRLLACFSFLALLSFFLFSSLLFSSLALLSRLRGCPFLAFFW